MKILITGAAGYIGRNIFKALENIHDVYGFGLDSNKVFSKKKKFILGDITNTKLVLDTVAKIKPDVVIHTAAISSLKLCNENYDEAVKVNVTGTENIVNAIKKVKTKHHKDIKLIFLSSDYVFDGNKGDYTEDDIPTPNTTYGKLKLLGEKVIQKELKNFIIVRLSNVYLNGGNFYEYVKKNLENLTPTEYYKDAIYSPIDIHSLKQLINSLLKSDLTGVLHVSGSDYVSRYEFAAHFANVLKKDASSLIIGASSPKDALVGKNQSLNTNKLKKLIPNIARPSVREALYLEHGVLIKPYFSFGDSRGSISGIYQGDHFEEINYVESKPNIIRGNHYHDETDELIHVLSGKMEVTLFQPTGNILKVFEIKKGDTVYLMPKVAHRFETKTNAKWINLLSKAMSDVKKDIIPVNI